MDEMKTIGDHDGGEYLQSSSVFLVDGNDIGCSPVTDNSEDRVAQTMEGSMDAEVTLSDSINAGSPSQNTNVMPSETRIRDESNHSREAQGRRSVRGVSRERSSDTKIRFRASRAHVPGAIASSISSDSIASTEVDGVSQGDVLVSMARRSTSESFEGLSYQDESLYNVSEEFPIDPFPLNESYDDPPCIVTAEVVEGGTSMDNSERRRIVQETIQTISNQAVEAELVHVDNEKLPRLNYRIVVLILISIVIVFVVVLVIVLSGVISDSDKDLAYTPTSSPTPFVDDSVFRTTEELYQAVDAYRMLSWNSSNESSFQSSDVALAYGYPISSWNVSLISNFSYVFDQKRFAPDIPWDFNEDLGNWDVSNAEYMVGMFMNAYNFQGLGLENWNVGKVRDFTYMFMNSGFNGSISRWDTSKAEIMIGVFWAAFNFNGDLSMWNVARVNYMNNMFNAALSFEGNGLEYWDVQNVRDFSYMFSNTPKFNASMSSWNTTNAETMEGMFTYASAFNRDLSTWDVSKVTNMISMFYSASEYTGEGIASWDVSNVSRMDSMFSDAVMFNGDVSHWDLRRVQSLASMFYNAASFNQNLSAWNVSGLSTMNNLFQNAARFNGDVSMWDVSNVVSFTSMFNGCSDFNGNLSSWNTKSAQQMNYMFSGATKFQGQGLSNWDTSAVFYLDFMFSKAASFTEDISSWDVSKVVMMANMFDGATSFNVDLSRWNVSSVMDASYMFSDAASFNYSLCPWNDLLPSTVLLDRIFIESGCGDTSDPTLNGTSFCGPC